MRRHSVRSLLVLFGEMFRLAATVLGGGYVILAVADERFSRRRWIRAGELFDALPLFQMVPGIIGGHTAVYLGHRVAGVAGACVALLGMMLPSLFIFTGIALCYRRIPVAHPLMAAAFLGLRAALTGLMLEIVVRTWRKSVSGAWGYALCAAACATLLTRAVSPGWAIVAGMLLGVFAQRARDGASRGRPDASGPDKLVFRSFWMIPVLFIGYGLMAFGGGFVLVPVYLRDFVGETAAYLQFSPHDFAHVMALTEMSPGPIAINCATFFGYELAGFAGAFVATMALLVPGLVILLLALRSVERFRSSVWVRGVFLGVRPVTMALMVCATVTFASMSVFQRGETGWTFSPPAFALASLAFLAVFTHRLGGVAVILLSAVSSALFRVLTP